MDRRYVAKMDQQLQAYWLEQYVAPPTRSATMKC